MIKKIALFVLALLPLGAMAQNQKIGHVNTQEIISIMPEIEQLDVKIKAAQDEWEKMILKSREEYFTKIKDFQASQATMSESIKEARQAELADMDQRISTLTQQAKSDLEKKQQELAAPILDKVRKAISEVGAENGYTYIFDMAAQSIVYTGPSANDITPLVKKKLNLKDKPAPATTTPAATPKTTTETKK